MNKIVVETIDVSRDVLQACQDLEKPILQLMEKGHHPAILALAMLRLAAAIGNECEGCTEESFVGYARKAFFEHRRIFEVLRKPGKGMCN